MTRSVSIFVRALLILGMVSCEKKKEAPPPLTVTVAKVESRDVTAMRTWVGLLNGFQNANVQAQVTGYLLSQNYKEGSFVKKGTVLFQIDPRPFEAALAQAQADYAQKVAQAQLAQITLDRQTQLFKTKVISQQEYDTSAQDAQAATAAAAAAQAYVQAAQVNLEYCTIIAPFDGIVGTALAQIGDLVGPGGSESILTQISQVDPIKAIISLTEEEYLLAYDILARLEDNPSEKNKAVISLKLANGKEYDQKGRFYFVNRQVDTKTGSITMETLFPNPRNMLRPGLFARVTAPVKELKGALLVPQQAVVELQGNLLISTVDSSGKVDTFPVQRGPVEGQMVVVTSPNLKEGMSVVVGGVEKVRPGMVVVTKPFEPPTPQTAPEAKQAPTASPEASPKKPQS